MNVKILKIYKTKEEIKKIVNQIKNYSFEDLNQHSHFEFSVIEKSTDIELLQNSFKRFELIKSIL